MWSFHTRLLEGVPVGARVQKATEECDVLPQGRHCLACLLQLHHHLGSSLGFLLMKESVTRPDSLRFGLGRPPLVGGPYASGSQSPSDGESCLPPL